MSFRCGICNEPAHSGTKPEKVVLKSRNRTYPYRPEVHMFVGRDGKVMWRDDPGGQGWEIVQEVDACPRCASERRAKAKMRVVA